MAHQYTTAAVVLGTRNVGEANTVCTLFTQEFGLIYGNARSARKSGAKLVANVQTLTYGVVTLVRGKREWKIVGSVEETNLFYVLRTQRDILEVVFRLMKLVKRLVRGEERNESLFLVLTTFVSYVSSKNLVPDNLEVLERLIALRVLAALGYAVPSKEFMDVIMRTDISDSVLATVAAHKTLATSEINRALKEAQL
jgi:DNA repair protein RecO